MIFFKKNKTISDAKALVSIEAAEPGQVHDSARTQATEQKLAVPTAPIQLSPAMVEACAALPIATAIITAVPAETEKAVFTIIERFEKVQELTGKASTLSRQLREQSEGKQLAIASRTREAIAGERQTLKTIAGQNRQNAKQILNIGKELEKGLALLANIEEITEQSRLIAFNMAVEAARIGEKGLGFKVIHRELKNLNDRTADFSRQIGEMLKSYREFNGSLATSIDENEEKLIADIEENLASTEEAVEALIQNSEDSRHFTTGISELVEAIDTDMTGVLESLQFQDYTRQMLESAAAITASAGRTLYDELEQLQAAGSPDSLDFAAGYRAVHAELRKKLTAKAKTAGEKEAISRSPA
ncbi:MAG: methyl-accepting chemotaxis protein [Spirochaetes bacterium]|nr:methyl-accepting chemotaxis protein [Spirochaetota bacterium]